MAKKIVKKKKLRVFRLLIVLLIFVGLFFGVDLYLKIPIKNIIIKNTTYLNDDYILELANIKNYPSFWLTTNSKLKQNLQKSPYIKKVNIKRKFYNVLVLEITENKGLFINNTTNNMVLNNKEEVPNDNFVAYFRVPRLLNYVPDDKYAKFIKGMNNIKKDILGKISDIEYKPNNLDKDRFLLYMDDGNMVYLTLTKFNMINYYNDVLKQLEDRKGILYLDNGNHFQIKE